jgi:peroxiredoxin
VGMHSSCRGISRIFRCSFSRIRVTWRSPNTLGSLLAEYVTDSCPFFRHSMAEKKVIDIGQRVREFTLKDQHNNDLTLSDFKGGKVLLSFHPLAWTDICATQMKDLERKRDTFKTLNTAAIGVSVDSVPSKAAWARSLEVSHTRLLSDFWPHGGLAQSLGILREQEGFSERANIVLDENGAVIFVKIYPIPEVPDIDEIIAFIQEY